MISRHLFRDATVLRRGGRPHYDGGENQSSKEREGERTRSAINRALKEHLPNSVMPSLGERQLSLGMLEQQMLLVALVSIFQTRKLNLILFWLPCSGDNKFNDCSQ